MIETPKEVEGELAKLTKYHGGSMSCEVGPKQFCDGFGPEHLWCWLCRLCKEHPHAYIMKSSSGEEQLVGIECLQAS